VRWCARTIVQLHCALWASRPQLKRDRLDSTHMIQLSLLEQDILGDMASDSHGVGELVGFIRSANPFFNNGEIFRELYDLLDRWIARGWLQLRPSLAYPTDLKSIDELLPFLNRVGPDAMDIDSNAVLPEVDLTDQAFVDVEWLRGAV